MFIWLDYHKVPHYSKTISLNQLFYCCILLFESNFAKFMKNLQYLIWIFFIFLRADRIFGLFNSLFQRLSKNINRIYERLIYAKPYKQHMNLIHLIHLALFSLFFKNQPFSIRCINCEFRIYITNKEKIKQKYFLEYIHKIFIRNGDFFDKITLR